MKSWTINNKHNSLSKLCITTKNNENWLYVSTETMATFLCLINIKIDLCQVSTEESVQKSLALIRKCREWSLNILILCLHDVLSLCMQILALGTRNQNMWKICVEHKWNSLLKWFIKKHFPQIYVLLCYIHIRANIKKVGFRLTFKNIHELGGYLCSLTANIYQNLNRQNNIICPYTTFLS